MICKAQTPEPTTAKLLVSLGSIKLNAFVPRRFKRLSRSDFGSAALRLMDLGLKPSWVG